jgi:CheY-like chemotaxis protein
MTHLRLFIFEGSEVLDRTYSRFPVRIGRHPRNECQLADSHVSRFHAQIECESGGLVVRDVGSANGTLLMEGASGRMLRGSGARSSDGELAFLLGYVRVLARIEEGDTGDRTPSSGQRFASRRELTDRAAAGRSVELPERLELRETQGKRTTRVLIVEDDDPIAKTIARLLGHSFEIVRAVDGVAARDLLIAGASFDVILSDVNMPRLDGFGLLRWLQVSHPEVVSRVVFMSVDPDLPASREIALTHVHPVLRKPCTRDVLLDAVRAAREGARGRDG